MTDSRNTTSGGIEALCMDDSKAESLAMVEPPSNLIADDSSMEALCMEEPSAAMLAEFERRGLQAAIDQADKGKART